MTPKGLGMDASKQATRKDEGKQERGKDDVKHGVAEGRYEGGRDSDQNRQAKDRGHGRDDKAPEPAATPPTTDRRGMDAKE